LHSPPNNTIRSKGLSTYLGTIPYVFRQGSIVNERQSGSPQAISEQKYSSEFVDTRGHTAGGSPGSLGPASAFPPRCTNTPRLGGRIRAPRRHGAPRSRCFPPRLCGTVLRLAVLLLMSRSFCRENSGVSKKPPTNAPILPKRAKQSKGFVTRLPSPSQQPLPQASPQGGSCTLPGRCEIGGFHRPEGAAWSGARAQPVPCHPEHSKWLGKRLWNEVR
jgi:hypothetical protein